MVRFFLLAFFFISAHCFAQSEKKARWVDSVFSKLTVEERIGQKIMTFFVPHEISVAEQSRLIKAGKIGGLYVVRTGILAYARTMNDYQALAKVPLFIADDVSHNFAWTIDSVMSFYPTVVESMADDSLRKNITAEREREMKALGIHLNFDIEAIQVEDLRIFDLESVPDVTSQKLSATVQKALSQQGDILIAYANIDKVIKAVTKAVKKDALLANQLDESVKKILAKKFDLCMPREKINTDNLFQRLHTTEANLLKQQLAHEAIEISRDSSGLIPISSFEGTSFASISIGLPSKNEFAHYLSKYSQFNHYSIQELKDTSELKEKLYSKKNLVVGLFSKKLTEETQNLFRNLSKAHQLIVVNFLDDIIDPFKFAPVLINAYSGEEGIPRAAAQVIFGGIESKRKPQPSVPDTLLPKTLTKSVHRFSYELPEAAGMDSQTLDKIEKIAKEGIDIGAMPCVNVLVAKNGKVVYEKSFGSLTYDKQIPATDEIIFDLASITKVSATLQAVTYLYEKGMIDLNKKASTYLPELKGSNKEDLTIKDILTHQAGLWPFLPFWAETVKDTTTWKKYYNKNSKDEYPFPVAENMFAIKAMKDSLWQWIIKSKVRDKTVRTIYDYRYSDMAFYMMQHLAEKLLGMPMDDFLQSNFYRPIGAYTMGYQPLRRFSASQIAPTEKDTLFRKSLLIGYVHDQGAAMHGGVAGHAGLFSNANDLAKIGQMWLNKGSYGGIQFFKPETIELFTSQQYETSSRGLGWDKAILNNTSISMYASSKTFGHTGFTGTCIWVDPQFNLVFIFLSNRVYPNMNNNKILTSRIRQRIQDVVYQSIFEYCKNHEEPLKPNELKSGLTVKPLNLETH